MNNVISEVSCVYLDSFKGYEGKFGESMQDYKRRFSQIRCNRRKIKGEKAAIALKQVVLFYNIDTYTRRIIEDQIRYAFFCTGRVEFLGRDYFKTDMLVTERDKIFLEAVTAFAEAHNLVYEVVKLNKETRPHTRS